MVAEEIADAGRHRVPAAVRPAELRHAAARGAAGRSRERVPLLDARFFVTAVLTQRESGGNLSEVLDNLAHGHSRALQGQAPGACDFRARTDHRLGALGAASGRLARVLRHSRITLHDASQRSAGNADDRWRRVFLQLVGIAHHPEDRQDRVLRPDVAQTDTRLSLRSSSPWRSLAGLVASHRTALGHAGAAPDPCGCAPATGGAQRSLDDLQLTERADPAGQALRSRRCRSRRRRCRGSGRRLHGGRLSQPDGRGRSMRSPNDGPAVIVGLATAVFDGPVDAWYLRAAGGEPWATSLPSVWLGRQTAQRRSRSATACPTRSIC